MAESDSKVEMDAEIDKLINETLNLQIKIKEVYDQQKELIKCNSEESMRIMKQTKQFDEYFEKSLLESEQNIDEESTLFEQYFKMKNDQINELCDSITKINTFSDLDSKINKVFYYVSENQVKKAVDTLRYIEKFLKDNIHDLHYYGLLEGLEKFINEKFTLIKSMNVKYLKNVIKIEHDRSPNNSKSVYGIQLCYNDRQLLQQHFHIFYELHNDDFTKKFYNLMSLFYDIIFEKMMQYDYYITTNDYGFIVIIELLKPFVVYFDGLMNDIKYIFRFFFQQFGDNFAKLFPVMDFEQQFVRYFRTNIIPREKDEFLKNRAKISVHLLNFATFLTREINLDLNTDGSLIKNFHSRIDEYFLEQRVSNIIRGITDYVTKNWLTHTTILFSKNDNTIRFPISGNIKEFMKTFVLLIEEIVVFELPLVMKHVEDILILLIDVLVTTNKKVEVNVPKQIAFFYNNLIYMSEELSELFFNTYEEYFRPYHEKLFELSHQFKTKANEILNEFISDHNTQIDSLLKESGLIEVNIGYNTEDIIRQCIRQLEILKHTWHNILPDSLYFDKLAFMSDYFLRQLIRIVQKFEDLPATVARKFWYIYRIVLTRTIPLFPTEDDLERYVDNWGKFNTLIFVLNADLSEIEDQVGVEDSILQYFPTNELHAIIRAIFQNTSRRSELLSKIK